MNRILSRIAPPAVIMAAVGILGSLGANAKLLPFNETYFPDALVSQWITDK